MTADSWARGTTGYTPTVLLGRLPEAHHSLVMESLIREGWDVRTLGAAARETAAGEENAELLSSATRILPDLIITSGTPEDPWAQAAIMALRSDPATHDTGLVIWTQVSLPGEMEVTPMSGPDAWVYPNTTPQQALERIQRAAGAAVQGRLEWAHRDWTEADRRRNSIRSLQLRIEQGRNLDAETMAAGLFGNRGDVDTRVWDLPSPHPSGWRYGSDARFDVPLLVNYDRVEALDPDLSEQVLTFYSRSARLLLAAAYVAAEIAGGWPALEIIDEEFGR